MNTYELRTLLIERAKIREPYLEFLRAESMSTGIYVLAPGEEDQQTPHREDELYYVVEGEAKITVADQVESVHPGTAIFVAANVPHRFHSIMQELVVLVIFAPPESNT